MGNLLDSDQFAQIRKNLKESVKKDSPAEPIASFKEHVEEPVRKKDYDQSRITRDGISSMHESIKTVKENHPQDPTLIFGQDLNEQSTDHYASAIRDHSDHIQKQNPVNEAGLFDGDPMDAPISRKDFFKLLNTSLSSIGGGGVGLDEVRHYVDDKIQTAFDVDFGNTFVNTDGDTMDGSLVIQNVTEDVGLDVHGQTRIYGTLSATGAASLSHNLNINSSQLYPFDVKSSLSNDQSVGQSTVRFQSNLKVKKNNEGISGTNLLDVQRDNDALVLDGTVKTKKLEHFSGTNSLIELRSGIYQNVTNKFTGSNYGSMMHRTFYNGIPYIDYSVGAYSTADMDYDADHPVVWKEYRRFVQYLETTQTDDAGQGSRWRLRSVYDEADANDTGLQRLHNLKDPIYAREAAHTRFVNGRSSRLQPSYIGDSVQRSIIEAGLSTPLDSLDSTAGVGTMFINTAGARPRLQFWKDSQWQDLRSKFDSDETVGLINSLRYTTANHDSDTLAQVDSDYVRTRVPTDQNLRTTDDVTFQHIHMTHASGALSFAAKNETGGTVTKGTVVFINGVSGDVPTIGLADADGVGTMPAYGLVEADANNNAETHVLTFGTLDGIDTSAFAVGDTLYVSTTPGVLTNVPPAGSSANIQNIGRVIRSHASAGSIKVGGAGRSNATPNLDAGYIFYGSDSNRSVATELTTIVDSNYVQARQITYDFLDSAEAINLIDSAYVQARVTFPADQVGIDSATSISLTQSTVDSAYVQTRIDATQLDFSGVPTSDPLTAGLVWRDSDNGNVLKVSVG